LLSGDADAPRVLRLSSHDAADPTYGSQLQTRAVPGLAAEGSPRTRYTPVTIRLEDGTHVALRRPTQHIAELAYGPLAADTQLSLRRAPLLAGVGLLQRLDEDALRSRADPDDADGDGISGRARLVLARASGERRLGRFGWQAERPSLDEQNQAAFHTDIGLSTPLFPDGYGDCTAAQTACRQAPDGGSPQYDKLEIHAQLTEMLLRFVASLPAPQRDAPSPAGQRGEALFTELGCAACHVPAPGSDPASAPTATCCCTTWARAWPSVISTTTPATANGAPRPSGVSAPSAAACCTTAAPATCKRPSSGMVAKRRPARRASAPSAPPGAKT